MRFDRDGNIVNVMSKGELTAFRRQQTIARKRLVRDVEAREDNEARDGAALLVGLGVFLIVGFVAMAALNAIGGPALLGLLPALVVALLGWRSTRIAVTARQDERRAMGRDEKL